MYALQVEKMSCGGCASRVKKAVLAVDETAQVDVDLRSKTVNVESGVAPDRLAATITGAGYPATARDLQDTQD